MEPVIEGAPVTARRSRVSLATTCGDDRPAVPEGHCAGGASSMPCWEGGISVPSFSSDRRQVVHWERSPSRANVLLPRYEGGEEPCGSMTSRSSRTRTLGNRFESSDRSRHASIARRSTRHGLAARDPLGELRTGRPRHHRRARLTVADLGRVRLPTGPPAPPTPTARSWSRTRPSCWKCCPCWS